MLCGVLIIALVVPRLADQSALLIGWTAVVGLGMVLFFGLFHVLSCAWRQLGVVAPPQWRWPGLAASAGDFWGNRWNRAFRRMSLELIHRPLSRRIGTTGAMAVVFLISGIAHEGVVSIPAWGGWGLPTVYFLLQAAVVTYERTPAGRRMIAAGGGLGGRMHVALFTWLPAFLLFHPPFLDAVILPGMRTLGAL